MLLVLPRKMTQATLQTCILPIYRRPDECAGPPLDRGVVAGLYRLWIAGHDCLHPPHVFPKTNARK